MHSFKDNTGHEWRIELNVAVNRKVRTEIGVDLNLINEDLITKLYTNPEMLVDVISIVLTDQIKKQDLDEYGFASRIIGDTVNHACDALMDELVFISPRSQRAIAGAAWKKIRKAESMLEQKAMSVLGSDKIDEKLQEIMDEMEEKLMSS